MTFHRSLEQQKLPGMLGELYQSIDLIIVPYKILSYTELYGLSQNTNNRVCADPKIINENFEVNQDCNINSNGTIYNVTVNVMYWINVTKGHIRNVAACCKRFHLVPRCNTGVLNTSLVIIKNKSFIAHINNGEKI